MTTGSENLTAEDLLPHKGNMLLIDDVVEISEEAAVSRSCVTEQWPLVTGQAANLLLIVELVAQTSGLCNGFALINRKGKDVSKKGWVVGIKRAQFYVDEIPVGANIETRAVNCFKFESFVEIEGDVRIGDDILGEVVLQVMKAE